MERVGLVLVGGHAQDEPRAARAGRELVADEQAAGGAGEAGDLGEPPLGERLPHAGPRGVRRRSLVPGGSLGRGLGARICGRRGRHLDLRSPGTTAAARLHPDPDVRPGAAGGCRPATRAG